MLETYLNVLHLLISIFSLFAIFILETGNIKIALRKERKLLLDKILGIWADITTYDIVDFVKEYQTQHIGKPISYLFDYDHLSEEAKYLFEKKDFEEFEEKIKNPVNNFIKLTKEHISDEKSKGEKIWELREKLQNNNYEKIMDDIPILVKLWKEKYLDVKYLSHPIVNFFRKKIRKMISF